MPAATLLEREWWSSASAAEREAASKVVDLDADERECPACGERFGAAARCPGCGLNLGG